MNAIYAYRPRDPAYYPAGIEARAPSILAAWLACFPTSEPSTECDPEDWIESACVIEAADKAGLGLTFLPPGRRGVMVSGDCWHVPDGEPGSPIGAMLGSWLKIDSIDGLPIEITRVGSTNEAVRTAATYGSSAAFRAAAGRPTALADATVDGPSGIDAAIRTVVAAQGHGRIFVKTTQKGWARRFDVDPASDKGPWAQIVDADMRLEEETDGEEGGTLCWITVQHEGSKDFLLVQGMIEPTFEYRVVVIDGRPVTGSGCVEAFTPAENEAVFDPKMERVRSSGEVVSRQDIALRYLEFAQTFCDAFAAERGTGLDYALDLCIDANTGEIVPIELNPALNLGMYARSTDAWLAAIVERTERVAAERGA